MASFTRHRIASRRTTIIKLVPPPLLGLALVMVVLSIVNHSLPAFPDGLFAMAVTLSALAFFSWVSYRLKFVAVDSDYLYVSGWFKEIAIPYSNIEDVNYFLGLKAMPVTVRLKSPSAFGVSIYFIPTVGAAIRARLNVPSVVEDLRHKIRQTST